MIRLDANGAANQRTNLQRFAVILDRSALWSIDAYLEELRGKIGEAVKRAIPKSKVVWLNLTATRYTALCSDVEPYRMIGE